MHCCRPDDQKIIVAQNALPRLELKKPPGGRVVLANLKKKTVNAAKIHPKRVCDLRCLCRCDTGPREPTQRRGHPGVPAAAAPSGHSQRPAVHPALPHGHREAMARVPAPASGGAVPRQGGVSRRHQERECSRYQRELGPADGLCSLQADFFAGEKLFLIRPGLAGPGWAGRLGRPRPRLGNGWYTKSAYIFLTFSVV